MKNFAKMKKYGIVTMALIAVCSLLTLFFMNVNFAMAEEPGNEGFVSSENTSDSSTEESVIPEDTHSCLYFIEANNATDMGPMSNQLFAQLLQSLSGVTDSSFANGVFSGYFYLTEDITWTETVYIPQNMHVGVCLNGHTFNCEFDYSTKGDCGVYVFDCTQIHSCSEITSSEVAFAPVLTQPLLDFMPYWMQAGGGLPSMDNLCVALGEDISFGREWTGMLGSSGALTVCLNGYRIFNSERLTTQGGTLTLLDCQPDKPCNYLLASEQENSKAIELGTLSANEFSDFVTMLNNFSETLTEPYAIHCTLRGGLSLSETINIPENVYIGVCLNGYKLNATVALPDSGNGGFYTFNCEDVHTCSSLQLTVPYLSQDLLDFLLIWGNCGGGLGAALNSTAFALASDIIFNNKWSGFGAGMSLTFCTCGFIVENTEILAAEIITVNCATDDVCRVCHPLNGLENIPLCEVDLEAEGVFIQETLQDGSGTQTITKKVIDCFTPYVDADGVFIGDGTAKTKYLFTLQSDVKLAKTLIIPDGMDVHICLNGYTLEGPRLIFYKEKEDIVGIFEILYGGSLSIYDCSPDKTGSIVNILKDSVAEKGSGIDLSGLGVIFAYSIMNAGSFTMNGGTMTSMIGIINGGDVTINDGALGGALMGIVQGSALEIDGTEFEDSTPSVTMNGGSISSALVGVLADTGDVAINDGTIKTVQVGIGIGVDVNGDAVENSDASLVVNGGTIEYGESVLDVFADTGMFDGMDVDINAMQEEMEIKDVYAIAVNGSVQVNGDLDVVYSDTFLAMQEKTAEEDTANRQAEADANLAEGEESVPVEPTKYERVDFALVNDTVISVGEDAEFENQYKVFADSGKVIADRPLPEVFVGTDGLVTIYDKNGNLVIFDATKMQMNAKAVGATASTSGLILLNFYVKLGQDFIDNSESRIIIRSQTQEQTYAVNDGKPSGEYYVFSIGVCAKDYKEKVVCEFSMPLTLENGTTEVYTWHGQEYSIEQYLTYILEDTSGTYDSAKTIAAAMKDYCMTASVHFGISQGYEYTSGMEEEMAKVDGSLLEPFKTQLSPVSANVTLQGATLFLEYATTIRIYFSLQSGVDINTISCTIDGNAVSATAYRGNLYYIEVENIAASNLGKAYEINVDGTILHYSAMSYAYSTIINAKEGDETAVAAVKMLYLYYKAAEAYNN